MVTLLVTPLLQSCAPARATEVPAQAAEGPPATTPNQVFRDHDFIDLSVTVSESLPAHWASNPPMQRWTANWFAPQKNTFGTQNVPSAGAWYGQRYVIDEHTGTQTDFPAHFIPPPGSNLPFAGPAGALTGDKYPLDRLLGPAVVIDVRSIVDAADNGKSAPITLSMVQEWEKKNSAIQKGDVVLFHSGYTDKYYKPLPEGERMTYQPVSLGSKPGWPAPTVELMEYLHQKGIWHLGTDGASMGPCEGGQAVHVAGLKHGMSWEEMLTNLGRLPARGAFYIALPLKIADQSGSPTRAIAFVPRKL